VQGMGVGTGDPPVAEDTDADRVAHHGDDPLKELRGLSIRLESEETRA
jgi:D-mannonate dehydratase